MIVSYLSKLTAPPYGYCHKVGRTSLFPARNRFESSNPSIKNANPSFSYPIDRKSLENTAFSGLFLLLIPLSYTKNVINLNLLLCYVCRWLPDLPSCCALCRCSPSCLCSDDQAKQIYPERDSVVIQDACYTVSEAVDCTVRQSGFFCQTVYNTVYSTQV